MLRFNDVHCTLAILSIREETPTHRLGIYFLEIGYDITSVAKDRKVPSGGKSRTREADDAAIFA